MMSTKRNNSGSIPDLQYPSRCIQIILRFDKPLWCRHGSEVVKQSALDLGSEKGNGDEVLDDRQESVDEFASLVAAALQVELDVCDYANRGLYVGGNSRRLTDFHGQHPRFEERFPPTPPTKKRPSLLNWWSPKSKYRRQSNSRLGAESLTNVADCSESKFESTTSTLFRDILPPSDLTEMAFVGDPSPTVLAASMSTVDLGANCLGLVAGGGCGSVYTSNAASRNGSPGLALGTAKKLNGNAPNGPGVTVTPTTPILKSEAASDAQLKKSPYNVGLDVNVIDISSTLHLPRTPSPSSRSPQQLPLPEESISPPPPPVRRPRKSFLAKLRSLSSKGSSDSSSNSPLISTPSLSPSSPNSKNAHIGTNDNSTPRPSPTRLFSLHLPFPLTPISLSKPNSPNRSRSPSPNPPHRSVSTSSKRESAPVVSANYTTSNGFLSINPESPIFSTNPSQDTKISNTRRIQSLYSLPTSREKPTEAALVDDGNRRSPENILNASNCLEDRREGYMNAMSSRVENTQPFPRKETHSSPELRDVSSERSNYSSDSAPRTVHGEFTNAKCKKGSRSEKEATSPVASGPASPVPHASVQDKKGPGELVEPPTDDQIFAPFVPLVLQHERLQQKLKKSVPLASFEGAGEVEGVGIKSVALGSFPPRSTSLSSSSIHIRPRTKSAPTAPSSLPLTDPTDSKSKDDDKNTSGIPPVPSLPAHIASASATTPTTLRFQPHQQTQGTTVQQGLKRPTTAPSGSTPNTLRSTLTGAVPFPLVQEDEIADGPRQRKTSKLFEKVRARNTLPPPLQPPGAAPVSAPAVNEFGEINPTKSGKDSVGVGYTTSKHPYANAQYHSDGMAAALEDDGEPTRNVKSRLKNSVSFLTSLSDSQKAIRRQVSTSSQRPLQTPVSQGLAHSSPSSPTNSGSGSDASTKSPITPRSPFWGMSAVTHAAGVIANEGVKIKSGMGLGILTSSPVQTGEEGSRNELVKQRYEVDTSLSSDDKKGRHVHPYSRPYPQTRAPYIDAVQVKSLTTNSAGDAVGSGEQPVSPSSASTSSALFVKRRPSKQTVMQNGSPMPTKPPPVGPLPLPPSNDEDSGSETYKMGAKKITQRLTARVENEVPASPVPSEYLKAVSVPPTPKWDDVADETASMSHPYGRHIGSLSDAHSQSSESYERDPEYEALLAANTMANVGELASMRNIGVSRKLMSAHHRASSSGGPSEGQKQSGRNDAIRSSLIGAEWTLFLGKDRPFASGSKDVFANMTATTGEMETKSLSEVRARTKSESALNKLAFMDQRPAAIKRARSSTTAGLAGLPHTASGPSSSTPPPPVPKPRKMRRIEASEDWTLSLPLLRPEKNENLGSDMTNSKDTTRILGSQFASTSTTTLAAPNNDIALSPSKRNNVPQPEVVVCIDGVVVDPDSLIDDADEITMAGSPIEAAFQMSLESLGLEDDSEAESLAEMSGIGGLPDPLLFSVPRVVSKGSGMECATWGDEEIKDLKESIRKKRRRLSDGMESLMGMAGVSVRMSVNADGESICIMDEAESVEDGEGVVGGTPEGSLMTDVMKQNLAKLNALSADLKRLNDLLRKGVGANKIDLKHAKSCMLLPSQTDDALRGQGLHKSSTSVSAKERVRARTERPTSQTHSLVAPSSNSPNAKLRPPLPFAPSSGPARSRPSTVQGISGHAGPGRSTSLSISSMTKSPRPSTTASMVPTIPVGVVGSGLKVGGNGRVISLSATAAAPPTLPIGNVQPGLKLITPNTESKEKRPTIIAVQGEGSDITDNTTISKRDSASSSTSTSTFFTLPSSSSTQTPSLDSRPSSRRASSASNRSSNSDSSTPTGTVLPCLTIVTSPSGPSSESQSPVDEVYTPGSSTLPTPLASSFPFPPPLPASLTTLGDDLNTVSKVLSATRRTSSPAPSSTGEDCMQFARLPKPMNPDASRLSSASNVSLITIMPSAGHKLELREDDGSVTLVSEAEVDNESTYSGSFYSARSSFEA